MAAVVGFVCAAFSTKLFPLFGPPHMKQFSEKFKEVKDAARLAREKSQDKELANSALSIAAPQVSTPYFSVTAEHSTAGMCELEAICLK